MNNKHYIGLQFPRIVDHYIYLNKNRDLNKAISLEEATEDYISSGKAKEWAELYNSHEEQFESLCKEYCPDGICKGFMNCPVPHKLIHDIEYDCLEKKL